MTGIETTGGPPEENSGDLSVQESGERSLLPPSWRVRLPVFEGPLDLLLHLVRINQVDIRDIPVTRICDQFHEYLDLMEEMDLDIAGEYIYEAAMLIHLKARLLLPQPKVEPGEELPEDPRSDLVQRLLEYQKLKEASLAMAEVSTLRSGLWTREWQEIDPGDEEDIELGDVSLFDLLLVFRRVLDRYDRDNPEPLSVAGESFSIRTQVDRLLKLLGNYRPLDLVDDLMALSCRGEAIAAFLAVLELARLQLLRVHVTDAGSVLVVRTTREVSETELATIGEAGSA